MKSFLFETLYCRWMLKFIFVKRTHAHKEKNEIKKAKSNHDEMQKVSVVCYVAVGDCSSIFLKRCLFLDPCIFYFSRTFIINVNIFYGTSSHQINFDDFVCIFSFVKSTLMENLEKYFVFNQRHYEFRIMQVHLLFE